MLDVDVLMWMYLFFCLAELLFHVMDVSLGEWRYGRAGIMHQPGIW